MRNALTSLTGRAPVEATTSSSEVAAPAKAVELAMKDVMRGFSPPPGAVDDRPGTVQLWVRETALFVPAVTAGALRSLISDNPRNPWWPSVQDVIERCREVDAKWRRAVELYYFGLGVMRPTSLAKRETEWERKFRLAMGTETWERYKAEQAQKSKEHARVPAPARDIYLRDALIRMIKDVTIGEAPCPVDITDAERRGRWLAGEVLHLDEWPTALLKEFGMPSAHEYAEIKAKEEEAQRKLAADPEHQARLRKELEAIEAEARERLRKEQEEGERQWAESLERKYPIVDGRRTLARFERKFYRDEGYSDEMLDAAIAELCDTPDALRSISGVVPAQEFREALNGKTFKSLLRKQRNACPEEFRPVH